MTISKTAEVPKEVIAKVPTYSRALHFKHILEEQGFNADQKEKLLILFRKVEKAFLIHSGNTKNFPNYHVVLTWLCQALEYSFMFSLKSEVKMQYYSYLWKELQIIIDEDQTI